MCDFMNLDTSFVTFSIKNVGHSNVSVFLLVVIAIAHLCRRLSELRILRGSLIQNSGKFKGNNIFAGFFFEKLEK